MQTCRSSTTVFKQGNTSVVVDSFCCWQKTYEAQSAILLSGSTVTLACLVELRLLLQSAEDPTKVCGIRPDVKDSMQKQGKANKEKQSGKLTDLKLQ